MEQKIYSVADAPFYASGDGITNDTHAIQSAIDTAAENGGGTVVLTAGKTFVISNIMLRSHVGLHFGDGAVLKQTPSNDGYTKYENGSYVPYSPAVGHNLVREGIIWDHAWLKNLPFIYAPEGTHDVKITGCGTISMDDTHDCGGTVHICPIGFYRVSDYVISDITIRDYNSYAMMLFTTAHGLVKNVKIHDFRCHNNDGLSLGNSHDIRVTGCNFRTGDDSCYIFSSYNDNRGHDTWWSTENPEPSYNIEIDHCDFESDRCKAFGFILWGYGCPDQEKVDVRDIMVHDNRFATMGVWYRRVDIPPISHVRFYNNKIDAIEDSFFKIRFNDVNFYHSMRQNMNPCFADGHCFWTMKKNGCDDSVGVSRDKTEEDRPFGFIRHLDKGDAELYQGVWLEKGEPCTVRIEVKTGENSCRLFVRETDSGEYIMTKDFSHTDWTEEKISFTVPKSANYQIGLQRGDAREGFCKICNLDLRGSIDGAFGFDRCDRDDKTDILHYFFDTEESKMQGVKPNV